MSRRKLDALRALADRPGTPAEGEVAREMLRKLEAKQQAEARVQKNPYRPFSDIVQPGDIFEFMRRSGRMHQNTSSHTGSAVNSMFTDAILAQREHHFPKGTRVYYNKWAYKENCPGVVVGYSKQYNRMRIKFDHLKTVRSVPVHGPNGWHISKKPLVDRLRVYILSDKYRGEA